MQGKKLRHPEEKISPWQGSPRPPCYSRLRLNSSVTSTDTRCMKPFTRHKTAPLLLSERSTCDKPRRRNATRAGKGGIPEKTYRPAASSGTIPSCQKPCVTRPRIEPCSHWLRRAHKQESTTSGTLHLPDTPPSPSLDAATTRYSLAAKSGDVCRTRTEEKLKCPFLTVGRDSFYYPPLSTRLPPLSIFSALKQNVLQSDHLAAFSKGAQHPSSLHKPVYSLRISIANDFTIVGDIHTNLFHSETVLFAVMECGQNDSPTVANTHVMGILPGVGQQPMNTHLRLQYAEDRSLAYRSLSSPNFPIPNYDTKTKDVCKRSDAEHKWPDYSTLTKAKRVHFPAGSLSGFSHGGNSAGRCRWVFSGISRFPPPFHSGSVPRAPLISLTSALKTLTLRAAQIPPLPTIYEKLALGKTAPYRITKVQCQRRGKREVTEKTRRRVASSATIPTCETPGVTRPGIESDGASCTTMVFVRDQSQQSPGVVSENHERPKSERPDWESNTGPPECVSTVLDQQERVSDGVLKEGDGGEGSKQTSSPVTPSISSPPLPPCIAHHIHPRPSLTHPHLIPPPLSRQVLWSILLLD
ncbi:hypothetical protein PR048_020379 [Dryococelus australis]|uniref:Uncharacterized protein n=1 Tax=Dryococelus australis TaxID=614101 RepID=A0ABQ9H6C9_9NEOP|nr:hypothetical protein PR048_020379 [Dryococelus australis]